MNFTIDPEAIEQESMSIIEKNVPLLATLPKKERSVVKRIIHTTGDFNIAPLVKIHPLAVDRGLAAIHRGCNIYTDVNMVLAGLNNKRLAAFGVRTICRIADPSVAEEASRTGQTRAMVAMGQAGSLKGDIIVIGNAPTALFTLCAKIDRGEADPTLVIGTPVGFVGASESKELLVKLNKVPYITIQGTRGGSTIAASIVNALLYM
ncbi:precorrin-8X methylmutase [Desulfoscipio sp. XC116]|uniref:precorrin-8X methylmutase n=1 Tax=Desulfoscipio sp. XC116 TaxID=3144975 RepID=UPI00325B6750